MSRRCSLFSWARIRRCYYSTTVTPVTLQQNMQTVVPAYRSSGVVTKEVIRVIICCAVVLRRAIGVREKTKKKSSMTADVQIGHKKNGEETMSAQSCKTTLTYLYHVFCAGVFQVDRERVLSGGHRLWCSTTYLYRDRPTG